MTETPNVTEGAVSGFGDEQLTPRPGEPASTLRGSKTHGSDSDAAERLTDAREPAGGYTDEQADSSTEAKAPFGTESSPEDYTVDEVNAYLDSLGDDEAGQAERNRVLDAELSADEPRVTIKGIERA